MCGIAGFTHLATRPDPELIRRAIACIHHRGPDQSGTVSTDHVSLGAVRLKIIDMHGGEQPMQSEDGDVTLVFNGEVYNHAELRRELEQLGHRFRSRCDTEVVLRAWLQWDVRSFSRLRGMYAFAVWSQRERRLVLCRDRMGIKPLYIRQHGLNLHFGSELKTLFAHEDVDRRIDPVGLNLYLSLNYIPGEHTMVEGIRKLLPGHYLEWRSGTLRTEAYWQYSLKPQPVTVDGAKEELHALLRASVAEHLVSDVPLGVWSSGGLDSSAVVHYAAEAAGRQIKTFSVSFNGRKFDESPWFREIARKYDTDHHEFDLHPEHDLPATIERMAWHSDEPSSDAGALPVWFLSKMSRQHVTVALSGEGADELFGGYNTYLADLYAARLRAVPKGLRRWAARASKLLPASDEKIGFDYKLQRMLQGALLPPTEAHLFWNGTFSPVERAAILQPAAHRRWPALPDGNFLYLDQKAYLPDDILCKTDRMSMAHSLEVRPPFLDHRIVEFAARLPGELKIRGTTLKFILRSLMADKLPQSVLTRRKEGFDIPAHQWLRTCLRPLFLETVSRQAVEQTGLFRWPVLYRFIAAHLDRRANYGYHLWGLLMLFLWIRQWNVQSPNIEPA